MWKRRAGSKYNNVWSEANGYKFQSKWERDLYLINLAREQAGEIRDLQLQVTFHLDVNGVHVCSYRADFTYYEGDRLVVEDAKGQVTGEYAIKRKLMRACHGIEVRETHRTPTARKRKRAMLDATL